MRLWIQYLSDRGLLGLNGMLWPNFRELKLKNSFIFLRLKFPKPNLIYSQAENSSESEGRLHQLIPDGPLGWRTMVPDLNSVPSSPHINHNVPSSSTRVLARMAPPPPPVPIAGPNHPGQQSREASAGSFPSTVDNTGVGLGPGKIQ